MTAKKHHPNLQPKPISPSNSPPVPSIDNQRISGYKWGSFFIWQNLFPHPMVSDADIRRLAPKDQPYKFFVGGGLYVMVLPTGTKSWRLKYRVQRVERMYSIGRFPETSVAEAINECRKAKALVRKGSDPKEIKRQAERTADKPRSKTFFRFALGTDGRLTVETATKLMILTPSQTVALRSFLHASENERMEGQKCD